MKNLLLNGNSFKPSKIYDVENVKIKYGINLITHWLSCFNWGYFR